MRVAIKDAVHWTLLRSGRIGASEVASLYDCGFQTRFELYHLKRGTTAPEDFSENERIILGRNLEAGIANAAAELYGLKLVKATDYFTDDYIEGFGSTPDYFLEDETVVEVKNCSWGAWRDNWIFNDDGTVEPPLRYQLQVQAQLACTGAPKGMLIALISGDRIVKCDIEPHTSIQNDMRGRITDFWIAVENGIEPQPDYLHDGATMREAWKAGTGSADLSGDPDVEGWLSQIGELRSMRKQYEDELEVIESRVLEYCVRNGFTALRANGGRISVRNRPAKPERQITYSAQPEKIELRITPAKN